MTENKDVLANILESIENQEAEAAGLNNAESPVAIDRKTAEIYLKFYKKILKEIDTVNEFCDNYIAQETERVNNSRKEQIEKLEKKAEYFKNSLQFFREHNPPLSGKTLEMVNGNLSFRSTREKFEHDDKFIVSNFFGGNRDDDRFFEEAPKKFSWTKFKKALTVKEDGSVELDGKTVEGVTVTAPQEEFYIA